MPLSCCPPCICNLSICATTNQGANLLEHQFLWTRRAIRHWQSSLYACVHRLLSFDPIKLRKRASLYNARLPSTETLTAASAIADCTLQIISSCIVIVPFKEEHGLRRATSPEAFGTVQTIQQSLLRSITPACARACPCAGERLPPREREACPAQAGDMLGYRVRSTKLSLSFLYRR